jgi:methyl-accepting chemotaxis protein-1 (serine sensor receptor)
MRFANLKIGVRLSLLGVFFFIALALLGLDSWRALNASNARSADAMARLVSLSEAIDTARGAQVDFKIQVQEWKDLLLRGADPVALKRHADAFVKSGEATRADLKKLAAILDKVGLHTPLDDEAIATNTALTASYLSAFKQYDGASADSAHVVDGLVKGMDREPTRKIDDIVDFIGAQARRLTLEMAAENAAAHDRATIRMLATVLITLALGGAIVVWLIRGITRPLLVAVGLAHSVAAGDLRSTVTVTSSDEIGDLLASLKMMQENLAHIVGQVRIGTDSIAGASKEIASGNLDLSARTEEQASSLEQTAASMIELTSTVRQNHENAGQASSLADAASGVAQKGGAAVQQMVATMGAINESSKRIVDIIGVIDGIAFQTNILALNAAVEAARAGEQGRGFAVVASEVRNLAQRSAAAAREIKALIGTSVERVDAGSRLAGEAGVTMEEVVSSVHRVSAIIGEISVASGEQQEGIEQIGEAISQMDGVTQQNAALVEQAAAAAEALQHQAASLAEAVSFFKLHDVQAGGAPVAVRPAARRKLHVLVQG